MLIGGIALGLVLGLVLGGKLERLADIRLQFLPLLFLAVIIRCSRCGTTGRTRASRSPSSASRATAS